MCPLTHCPLLHTDITSQVMPKLPDRVEPTWARSKQKDINVKYPAQKQQNVLDLDFSISTPWKQRWKKYFCLFNRKHSIVVKELRKILRVLSFACLYSLERVTQLKEDSMQCQDILKKCFVLFFWKNSQCRLLKKWMTQYIVGY